MEILAWLTLRIVYAWMFLWPLKALFADWKATEGVVGLICPARLVGPAAKLMVVVMVTGALSILLGVLPAVGGVLLFIYCLIGAVAHYRLGASATALSLSATAADEDRQALANAAALATVGHVTSAEKNFVLAALGLFFALAGTGPWSLWRLC